MTNLPDANPKTAIGIRKPRLSSIPPVALFEIGTAMDNGREKYGHMNWRNEPVSSSIYYDAALRHLMAWFEGEEVAEDSGVHHLAHVAACMAILLDAKSQGKLNDDRPTKGTLPAWINDHLSKY